MSEVKPGKGKRPSIASVVFCCWLVGWFSLHESVYIGNKLNLSHVKHVMPVMVNGKQSPCLYLET